MNIKEGLTIQSQHIARWASVLNAKTLAAVISEATSRNGLLNETTHTGYNVWRGHDICEFVLGAAFSGDHIKSKGLHK